MKRFNKAVIFFILFFGSATLFGISTARAANHTYLCNAATFFKMDLEHGETSAKQVSYKPTTIVEGTYGYIIKGGGIISKDRVLPFIQKTEYGADPKFQLTKRVDDGQVSFIGYGFKKPTNETNDDFMRNLNMSIVFEQCRAL